MRVCNSTHVAGKALQEMLQEVSKQLNLAKRYCQQQDRSLCESLQATGLSVAINFEEVSGICMYSNLWVIIGDITAELPKCSKFQFCRNAYQVGKQFE